MNFEKPSFSVIKAPRFGGGSFVFLLASLLVVGCKPNLESTDPSERQRAVQYIQDSSTLERLAIEDKDLGVREAALRRLSNQTQIANVALALDDSNAHNNLGQAVVAKLSDEGILTKVALEAKNEMVRLRSAEKLTNQEKLTKIAQNEKDPFVRMAAIKKLSDQTVLRKIAVEDDARIREIAIGQLTDQSALGRIAMFDPFPENRDLAYSRVRDHTLFPEGGSGVAPIVRANAVAALGDSDPVLKLISRQAIRNSSDQFHFSGFSSCDLIAVVKSAIQHPLIKQRLPNIRCNATVRPSKPANYHVESAYKDTVGMFAFTMHGEVTSILLLDGDRELTRNMWETQFPEKNPPHKKLGEDFLGITVSSKDVFEKLFQLPEFRQSDLEQLAHEPFQDIAVSAIKNITDQSLLAKIAVAEDDSYLRFAACAKLTDQNKLAEVVMAKLYFPERMAALDRISDEGVLKKLASESDGKVRESVEKRLLQIRAKH